MSEIDYTQLYIQAELETIAQKTEEILADPDGYECSACCIEGQPCDVGLAVKVERERIIALLRDLKSEFARKEELERYLAVAVKRINE